ncbi:MAG: YitT family protein [Bacillota bacterium]|nr:YitT family protein [Bacillota bacterium]
MSQQAAARTSGHTPKRLLMLLGGALIGSFAIHVFFLPATLTMGGMTGLGSMLHHLPLFNLIPFGILIAALNLPIFLLGLFQVSRRFLRDSIIGTLAYTLVIDLSQPLWTAFYQHYLLTETGQQTDLFLSSVLGGVIYGIGLGLMLRAGFTTGGTDILGIVIRRRWKLLSLGQIIWVLDALIILGSVFVYRDVDGGGLALALYSSIAMFFTSKALDLVLEGFDYKRTAFVISTEPEEIAERIMAELDRGVTALEGQGMYTGERRRTLLCVLSQEQIPQLKEIVKEADPAAFVFVMDTREVQGEGFEGTMY